MLERKEKQYGKPIIFASRKIWVEFYDFLFLIANVSQHGPVLQFSFCFHNYDITMLHLQTVIVHNWFLANKS